MRRFGLRLNLPNRNRSRFPRAIAIGMGTLAVSLLAITGPAGAAAVGYWHFDSDFTNSSGAVTEFSVGGKSGPLHPFSGSIYEAVFKADVLNSNQIRDLASLVINNGSSNTISDSSRAELDVYVRYVGCPPGWPSIDPVIAPEAGAGSCARSGSRGCLPDLPARFPTTADCRRCLPAMNRK